MSISVNDSSAPRSSGSIIKGVTVYTIYELFEEGKKQYEQ